MQREKSGISPLFLLLPLRPSQSISQEQFAKGTVWKTSWSQWREWGLGLCYPRGADPDAGKDWGQEEKGSAEDETVGWHHWFNGHEFEQTPGDSERQRSRACCSPWGHKLLDTTEWLNNSNPLKQRFPIQSTFRTEMLPNKAEELPKTFVYFDY